MTTHFDFHSIHDNVLKLDILGHDDPTMIRMLQDLSGIDPKTIPVDDKDTMQIFSGPESLGVTEDEIYVRQELLVFLNLVQGLLDKCWKIQSQRHFQNLFKYQDYLTVLTYGLKCARVNKTRYL